MPYVTQEYYNDTFHGEPVDNADFPSLLERAAEIVEEMCMYRISESNLNKYCWIPKNVSRRRYAHRLNTLMLTAEVRWTTEPICRVQGLESLTIQSPRGQRGVQNNPFIRPVHNAY